MRGDATLAIAFRAEASALWRDRPPKVKADSDER